MSTTLLPTTTLNHGEGSTGDESSLLQQLSSSYSSIWSAKTNTIPSAAALCVNTALMTAALALLSAASGSDKDTQALIEWAGLQQLNLEGLWMFSVCAAVVVLLLITGLLAVYSEQLTCRARTDSSYAEEATPRSALMARPLDADKQSVRNTVAYSRTLALFCDGLTLFMVAPIIQAALASIDTIAGSCGFLLALLALTAFKLLLSSADTIHHSYYTQEMCRAKEMFSSSAMAWALVLTYSTLLHQALVALAALRPGILFLGCAGYAVVHSCVAAAALLCVHRGRRMQLTLSLEDPPAALQQASSTHVPTIPGSHFTPAGGVLRKVAVLSAAAALVDALSTAVQLQLRPGVLPEELSLRTWMVCAVLTGAVLVATACGSQAVVRRAEFKLRSFGLGSVNQFDLYLNGLEQANDRAEALCLGAAYMMALCCDRVSVGLVHRFGHKDQAGDLWGCAVAASMLAGVGLGAAVLWTCSSMHRKHTLHGGLLLNATDDL